MSQENDFFEVPSDFINKSKIFPFQIYILNPEQKKYGLFLNSGRPLNNELNNLLNYFLDNGAKIAILKQQKKTFLNFCEIDEDQIPSLANETLSDLEKERFINFKLKEFYDINNSKFNFDIEFDKAITENNFSRLIEQMRMEVLCFPVTISNTTTLAIHFSKKYLIEDNDLNRFVAFTYHFTKACKIYDEELLSDIIVASFLIHIGHTQIPLTYSQKPYLNLNEHEKKIYEKHTILGLHIIKKLNLPISDKAKKLIIEHHERFTGTGYPFFKMRDSLGIESLIIAATSHLFDYHEGRIDGRKHPFKHILVAIKSKNFTKGLDTDFSEKIISELIALISTEKFHTDKVFEEEKKPA